MNHSWNQKKKKKKFKKIKKQIILFYFPITNHVYYSKR